ncbi:MULTISPECIES: hypothetical protein [unclassified Streptomyces]|uniref:hypothetical protein n=1 Tax=unclassified Streptomyces TaxID=2593676 RepID=UPI00344BDBEE
MSTIRSPHLSRGARRAAVAVCLLLTASGAAWCVRDLVAARQPDGAPAGLLDGAPGAAVYDPLLAATGLVAAHAARRGTPTAPGALLSLAAATALLRLPVLWLPDRPPGPDGALALWAQLAALAQLVLAAALLAVVAGGRRAAPNPLAEVAAAYGVVQEAPPHGARPGAPGSPYRGPAGWTAGFLGAAALLLAAGELPALARLGADGYGAALLGADAPGALPGPPPHWAAVALALLTAAAGAGALRRAPWSRPAAITAGVLLLGHGAAALVTAVRAGLLGHLAAALGDARLTLAAAAVPALAGLCGLCAAALPGVPGGAAGGRRPVAYGDGPDEARPPHAPPPPAVRPPGW